MTSFPITIIVSNECLGVGECEMSAPSLFSVGDESRSTPLRTIDSVDDLELAELAVRSCPTRAITLSIDD
jgi:ferredoxin